MESPCELFGAIKKIARVLCTRMRHRCRPDFSSRVLGMKVQNIDSSNTLHTGEPACGIGRASRLWAGTCQDLQLTQPPFRKATCSRTPSGSSGNSCGFYALEFEFQCRRIKVSAWGCRCRQWSREFKGRGIKLSAWGSRCRFGFRVLDIECRVLDFGFGVYVFGFGIWDDPLWILDVG